MGVRMLAVYGLPVGLVAFGLLIDRIGYPATITVATVAGLICTVRDRSPVARQHLGAGGRWPGRGRPRLITRHPAATRGALGSDF